MRKFAFSPESSLAASSLPAASYRVPTVSRLLPVVSAVASPLAGTSNRNQSVSVPGSMAPAVWLGSATRVAVESVSPWSSSAVPPPKVACCSKAQPAWKQRAPFSGRELFHS